MEALTTWIVLLDEHRLYGKPKEPIDLLCARWVRDLEDYSIRLFEQSRLMEQSWNIALAFQHAVYDCVYLALAEQLDIPLITADRDFVDKVKQTFPRARLLPGMEAN